MKKILIALDYGPNAQQVADQGYQLAQSMNADLLLLHVMVETSYYSTYEYSPITGFNNFNTTDVLMPDTIGEIQKGVSAFLEQTKLALGESSSNIQTLIKDGEPAAVIIETAHDLQADVIVLGSHSRRGLDKMLMGSVAEQVLRRTDIPLFIVPSVTNKQH